MMQLDYNDKAHLILLSTNDCYWILSSDLLASDYIILCQWGLQYNTIYYTALHYLAYTSFYVMLSINYSQ